ncbi:Ca2+-transporting ATPase [Rhodobacter viridis]|uniref:Ca2+-transporting ATPase n=1 Tax=Rhodobacter viridis TaxID=1054202 RepID=A0A318TN25_9RHOB|nr:cation-translocating P-type ATPase [Rhodobacter viridis]PYF06281.1 Ca2+-transporting ATPase [Rhodobacter viridis]
MTDIAERDSQTTSGLTEAEAAARLATDGPNELPSGDHRTGFRILLDVLREPMLALLLAGGAIYALLGETRDAAVLMVFACLSVLITLVQEWRSEKVLEALRDLSSPRALVIRDGRRQRIPGRDVVRGDVILLSEGDRVPADARLLSAHDLKADESLLTGEAVPVRKRAALGQDARQTLPGGDDLPVVFSGTLVVRGKGTAEVTATGPGTEIGKIGRSLASVRPETPRLYLQTRQIVFLLAIAGMLVSLLVGGLHAYLSGDWLDAVLAGIAIGMSMLPEEFPVVLAIFMAMGAWRLSRARVLTRRAAAIETLGAATILCTDKTGTLTQNRMAIRQVRLPDGRIFDIDGPQVAEAACATVLHTGRLACDPQPFDPMEQAFHAMSALDGPPDDLTLLRSYGLRPDLLAMSQVWRGDTSAQLTIATKGAPEAIATLCRLPPAARDAMARDMDAMAASGLRVLAIAQGGTTDTLPEHQQDLRLTWLGLVGLADPLRESVPQAVAECRRAGIEVKMITGDYPVTATAIAREAGLDGLSPLTGQELNCLDDAALGERLQKGDVFARIMPEQKLRIVNALKARNEVVAMTGDGVNDAPSLKSAHIGIAMGGRGTDVAREASAIVLLDDDFGSIVRAIRLGRRIYDNLRKAAGFIFAVHLPIAGLAIAPLLLGFPVVLGPIHIAFLEMVIDPVSTLVFEAEDEESDIMDRPPRDPAERLFSAGLIGWSLTQGTVAFAAVAAILFWGAERQMPADELRALSFFTLVIVIIALIFVNRSFRASPAAALGRPKPALLLVLAAVSGILATVNIWPAAQDIFGFDPLHRDDLFLTAGAGFAVLLILEALKPLWHRRSRTASGSPA